MKLKNKKTGDVIEVDNIYTHFDGKQEEYNSLKEFNDEWEDYEEPKSTIKDVWFNSTLADGHFVEIDFISDEAAEKAVEKLKAWKRLKDKGFRFTLTPGVGSLDIEPDKFQIEINAEMPAKWFCCDAVQKDLDDWFGGEE